MEYFALCCHIKQEEKDKFNLDFFQIVKRISEYSIYNSFFEIPYDRCAYMYKNAPCMISFIKDYVDKFLKECHETKDFLNWNAQRNLNFCSFSCGPALDYLAFCLAFSENAEINFTPPFGSLKVISSSAQWKHALQFLIDHLKSGYLKSFPLASLPNTFSVNQNPNMLFNYKQKVVVQDADVVFMVKTLNLSRPDEFAERKTYFQNIIGAMKVQSYLFCIDTKPSVAAMLEILNQVPGELIYGPVFNNFQLLEKFPDSLKEAYGCLPTVMARGSFFVWKKTALNLPVPGFISKSLFELTDLFINTTNSLTSVIEASQNSGIADDFIKDCNKNDDNPYKSEVCNLQEAKPKEISDNGNNLPGGLFSLYSCYKSVNRGKVTMCETAVEEMDKAIEQDVKSILSDICDAIDQDQMSKKLYSVGNDNGDSVTKNKLGSGLISISFDAFLEKMKSNSKISLKENERKINSQLPDYAFSNEARNSVPTPNVKSLSALDDLSNITYPSVESSIELNTDIPKVTLHPSKGQLIAPNADSPNANLNFSINTIKPNTNLSEITINSSESSITSNIDLSIVAHNSSKENLVESITYLPNSSIRSPIKPNASFYNVNLCPSVKSSIRPEADISDATLHLFTENSVQLNRDLSNVTQSFIESPIEPNANFPNVPLYPSIKKSLDPNASFSNVPLHSFMESSFDADIPHHLKFPSNQFLDAKLKSANSLDDYCSVQTSSSHVTKDTNSNSIQNPHAKLSTEQAGKFLSGISSLTGSPSVLTTPTKQETAILDVEKINSKPVLLQKVNLTSEKHDDLAFSDSLISSKVQPAKKRKRGRKVKKSLYAISQPNSVLHESNMHVNVLYSSMVGTSSSRSSTALNSPLHVNQCLNAESSDVPMTGKERGNGNKNPRNLNQELDKSPQSSNMSQNSSLNQNILKYKSKNVDGISSSNTPICQKSVSVNTNLENDSETNFSAIRHMTDRIKSLISSFDKIANNKENNISSRENEAVEFFHSHSDKSNLSNPKEDANELNPRHKGFQKPNASSDIFGSRENMGENIKNSKLEAKPEELCPSQYRCFNCCVHECHKVYRCMCTPMPNCPVHSCFQCARQLVHSIDQGCCKAISDGQSSLNVPNIVIPLQNISADALIQILAILKADLPK